MPPPKDPQKRREWKRKLSLAAKAQWTNPRMKKQHAKKMKRHWRDPEARNRVSEKMKRYYQRTPDAHRVGDRNPAWKGDAVQYIQLHVWVRQRLPRPELCVRCESKPSTEVANKTGKYLRDLSDWEWTCHRCNLMDGIRIPKRLWKGLTRKEQKHVNV